MKNFKFFGIAALIGLMVSCTKNIQEPSLTDIKSGTPIPVQAFSTSPCVDAIKSVAFDGTMLVFQNGSQFTRVMECLAQQVDDHGDGFESQTTAMTDDEASDYAESIGFDDDQPLINFENNLGFYSLRTQIASDLVQWLNHPVLDENTDPDNHVVIDDVLRALLNPAGEVKVGGTVYNFTTLDNMPQPEGLINCYMFGRFARKKMYDNDKKQLWVRTSLVGFPFSGHSAAKTKAVSYKLARGGRAWKRFQTDLSIQLNGGFRDFSCDNIGLFSSFKPPRRRGKLVDRRFSFESNSYFIHPHWLSKDDDFGSLVQSTNHPDAFLSVPIKMIWH